MEMLVTKFSNGKYRNEGELFDEPISAENVKLMGEMIALQALRTVKKFDMKVADRLYIGLIKDLHHMGEIDYIVSDGYDCAQTAICFLYRNFQIAAFLLQSIAIFPFMCYTKNALQFNDPYKVTQRHWCTLYILIRINCSANN